MKTIRGKILLPVTLIVTVSLILVGTVSILLSVASTNSTLQQTMTEAAKIGADRVSQEITRYSNITAEFGTIARVANSETPISQKQELLNQKIST